MAALPVAGLRREFGWPAYRQGRAVIVEPGKREPVRCLNLFTDPCRDHCAAAFVWEEAATS
jgi:hypothetical protein